MAEVCVCGHDGREHGRERDLYVTYSKREVCLQCPGYVLADEATTGYPNGQAWHRFKPTPSPRPSGGHE